MKLLLFFRCEYILVFLKLHYVTRRVVRSMTPCNDRVEKYNRRLPTNTQPHNRIRVDILFYFYFRGGSNNSPGSETVTRFVLVQIDRRTRDNKRDPRPNGCANVEFRASVLHEPLPRKRVHENRRGRDRFLRETRTGPLL